MEEAVEGGLIESRVPFLIWAALLVSFFPCGILYPLNYPVREIANLLIWVWAFPSFIGYLSLLTLPLLPSSSYGYFAFNLLCVLATFGVGMRVARWAVVNTELPSQLHRVAKVCMCVSLLLAAWQGIDGDAWLRVFPDMYSIGNGRGGGLRSEPSMLAPLLALYLAIVFRKRVKLSDGEKGKSGLFVEAAIISLTTLLLTRSLSVVVIMLCFLPAFAVKLRYVLLSGIAATLVGGLILWNRVQEAFADADSFAFLITAAVSSWRNVPDILILANMRDFLFPTAPADLRDKISVLATAWNPTFSWLENTYSTFSACASTFGLVVTTALFALGLFVGLRRTSHVNHNRIAWVALYIADWFILPKYEACGWIALALLTMATLEGVSAVHTASDELLPISYQPSGNSISE